MKFEVRPSGLAGLLLLPLVVLLDCPLPILLSLHVLAAVFCVGLLPQDLCEFALPFEARSVPSGDLRFRALLDDGGTVRECGLALYAQELSTACNDRAIESVPSSA